MSRDSNIRIFEDTCRLYESDPVLVEAVKNSIAQQKVILETDEYPFTLPVYDTPSKLIVTGRRSFEAALSYREKKVCVLNFASHNNPGGGVLWGSSAQEEALCRISTLYPCLTAKQAWEIFYGAHRRQNHPYYNDDCIYTPNVVVFKSDTNQPRILPTNGWRKVNVISCAAPNLRSDRHNYVPITNEKLYQIHTKRLRRILDIAADKGNEVMILGAYGCGAFRNPPEVVAKAMRDVVEEYRVHFHTIEFAVYCPPRDMTNFEVFRRIIGKNG